MTACEKKRVSCTLHLRSEGDEVEEAQRADRGSTHQEESNSGADDLCPVHLLSPEQRPWGGSDRRPTAR
jgi:hypothetical protein